jgi:hypothetical protein
MEYLIVVEPKRVQFQPERELFGSSDQRNGGLAAWAKDRWSMSFSVRECVSSRRRERRTCGG